LIFPELNCKFDFKNFLHDLKYKVLIIEMTKCKGNPDIPCTYILKDQTNILIENN